KINSVLFQAHNKIAFCKVKLGDLEGAEKELQKSLKIQPDDHTTLKYLGSVFLEDKKYKEAKFYLDSAKFFLKDDPELIFLSGRLKLETKDYKGALGEFNNCIFQKENFGEAYFKRGVTYLLLKNYPLVVRDINKGFEYIPNDTTNLEAYYARAEAAFEIGDFNLAVKDYSSVLKQEPKN
ncbi:MAG: tetratricopeptide repeat protein, partial [Bacteroidota bacterium]